MRKIIALIIVSITLFSSANHTFAVEVEEGVIEQILQLRTWIEGFKIEKEQLDSFEFYTPAIQNVYTQFKDINNVLKEEIMAQYQSWGLEYYQANGMIENHNKFVYYTNKLFFYLDLREKWFATGDEIDVAIQNSYTNVKSYYTRIKNLYNQ